MNNDELYFIPEQPHAGHYKIESNGKFIWAKTFAELKVFGRNNFSKGDKWTLYFCHGLIGGTTILKTGTVGDF